MSILERVAREGLVVDVDANDPSLASPFAYAEKLLGIAPLMVERQPIRPVEGGRSFASSRVDTPLHTDSQSFAGAPAALQILVCLRAAPSGGESLFVDGARLLARLERDDPSLTSALFEVDRVQRFYFGEMRSPTVALHAGHFAWTVAPGHLGAADEVGARLARELAREPTIEHALRPGEALVASNHRMLHGRRPFEGARELVRLLVWLEEPLAADARHVARAKRVSPAIAPVASAKLRAVLAILRGVPPAKTAADARVDEATLYAWRDAFVRGGLPALG